jgi:hypothetical protein
LRGSSKIRRAKFIWSGSQSSGDAPCQIIDGGFDGRVVDLESFFRQIIEYVSFLFGSLPGTAENLLGGPYRDPDVIKRPRQFVGVGPRFDRGNNERRQRILLDSRKILSHDKSNRRLKDRRQV